MQTLVQKIPILSYFFPGRDPDYFGVNALFALIGVCQLSHSFRPARNYTSIGL